MSPNLARLLEKARRVKMNDSEKEFQRRSFAFGSAKIENDDIDRELIDEAAERIPGGDDGTESIERS